MNQSGNFPTIPRICKCFSLVIFLGKIIDLFILLLFFFLVQIKNILLSFSGWNKALLKIFLVHLSRRLKGELIG